MSASGSCGLYTYEQLTLPGFLDMLSVHDNNGGKIMAKNLMLDGWEIGFSRDVLIAELERGAEELETAFNVSFAYDAAEAAVFLREDLDEIVAGWEGSENGLAFVKAFAEKF